MTDDNSFKHNEISEENDISFEHEEGEAGEGLLKDRIKELREKLKACQRESAENLAGWQRTKADLVNLKREVAGEKERLVRYAEDKLIEDILPVLEGYDGATRNKESWESVPKEWRIGVEYLFQKLIGTLEERGLKKIRPGKELFNPELHYAVESVPVTEKDDDNMVLELIREGYQLHEKVIRPAQVRVGNLIVP